MDRILIIALVTLECVALVAAVFMWRRRDLRLWAKVIWTFLLLIPLFGVLFYAFISMSPEPHNQPSDLGGFVP
jgi:hypothetical protein